MKSAACWVFCLLGLAGWWAAGVAQAAPPPAPPVSSIAPAKDLEELVPDYVKDLEEAVESEEAYKEEAEQMAKEANALCVLALTLGLHDEDNKFQKAAPALLKAAQQAAAAKDYASAKAGVEAVKAALATNGDPAALKWEPVASLPELMKYIPQLDTRVKRYVNPRRFAKYASRANPYSAMIAAIAQGTVADTSEAKNDEQVQQWYGFMTHMRDAAAAVNAACHKADEAAALAAMSNLGQSCDDCHAVFHPEELNKPKATEEVEE